MIKLSRALVSAAAHTLALPATQDPEDAPLEAAALEALDEFIACPVAHHYLAAMRLLSSLSRLRRRSGGLERLARHAIDTELDQLAHSGLLSPQANEDPALGIVEQLRALPADPRTPRRLQALSALLEAHREIALRVRAPERLRARMEVPDEGAPLRGRRADRRKRGRAPLRA